MVQKVDATPRQHFRAGMTVTRWEAGRQVHTHPHQGEKEKARRRSK